MNSTSCNVKPVDGKEYLTYNLCLILTYVIIILCELFFCL